MTKGFPSTIHFAFLVCNFYVAHDIDFLIYLDVFFRVKHLSCHAGLLEREQRVE